jgi:hypothetical protein
MFKPNQHTGIGGSGNGGSTGGGGGDNGGGDNGGGDNGGGDNGGNGVNCVDKDSSCAERAKRGDCKQQGRISWGSRGVFGIK